MILNAKPIGYGIGERTWIDWKARGSLTIGDPKPEKPKEKDEEFFSEEEFKI
jgi:hypothetical protein